MGGVGTIIPEMVATAQVPMVETATETIAHPGQMVMATGTAGCLQSNTNISSVSMKTWVETVPT